MAERVHHGALQDLEHELTCPICLSLFISPKLLACHHVFCEDCLIRLVHKETSGEGGGGGGRGQLILTCSTCRAITPVPASGVGGLQSAFHINHLFEVRKKLLVGDVDTLQPALVVVATPEVVEEMVKSCGTHPGEKLELFCETCHQTICSHCVFRGQPHHPHKYGMIKDIHGQYKKDIVSALDAIKTKRDVVTDSLSDFDAHISKLYEQQESVKTMILDHMKDLREIIDELESERIGQLYQIVQEKIDGISPYRAQLETSQGQLDQCIAMVMGKVDASNDLMKLIAMKPGLLLKIKDLSDDFRTQSLLRDTSGNIKFTDEVTRVTATIRKSLKVYYSDIDATKCTVSGLGLKEACVDQNSTVLVETVTSLCEPSGHLVDNICSELVSDITDLLSEVTVSRKGQNRYELCYKPTVKGRHQLHISIDGQGVPGSPYPIQVRSATAMHKLFLSPLKVIPDVYPGGVVVDIKGRVIISDVKKNSIFLFSQNGKLLKTLSGGFSSPRGLTLDDKGNIFIVDKVDNCVYKWELNDSSSPDPVCVVKRLDLKNPTDIAFNPQNDFFYITDTLNHRIVVYAKHAKSFTFGDKGKTSKSGLLHPSGVACDEDSGNVYVADCGNHRIQVFNAEGIFLSKFGKKGTNRGSLNYPCGIAVDYNKIIYVSDANDRVSLFTTEGRLVTSIGDEGQSAGLFSQPKMLAVDGSGVLYLADSSNSRVLMF